MPALDLPAAFVLAAFQTAIAAIGAWCLRPGPERFFLWATMGGLFFYDGIGAAYVPALWDYILHYGAFVLAFTASYVSVVSALRSPMRAQVAFRRLERLSGSCVWRSLVVTAYLATATTPLVYPEFRLAQVLHPPVPDLLTVLNGGILLAQPPVLRLNTYVGYIIWPFYLVALYGLRRKYVLFGLLVVAPQYLRYCSSGYVARSDIAMCLALYLGVIWLDRPQFRLRLTVAAVVGIPVLLLFFGVYARMRLGITSGPTISATEQVEEVLRVETSFPRFWDTLTSTRQRIDTPAYCRWLLTLPIPKMLTGEMSGVRVNDEISGIVSGIYAGGDNFTVTLTGPINESIYIYGMRWFWVHAVFIGVIAGVLYSFAAAAGCLLVVLVQFALLFAYVFSRAGVSAVMPVAVNTYLSLYLAAFVFWILRSGKTAATSQGALPRSAQM